MLILPLLLPVAATPSGDCHAAALEDVPSGTYWAIGLDEDGDGNDDGVHAVYVAETTLYEALVTYVHPWSFMGTVNVEMHFDGTNDYFVGLSDCATEHGLDPLLDVLEGLRELCLDCDEFSTSWGEG